MGYSEISFRIARGLVGSPPPPPPRFGGVSFLHVKAAEWGNPPYWGNQVFEHGKLFRRFHLQNRQNADEIDNACNNLCMESDSQANQWNQT